MWINHYFMRGQRVGHFIRVAEKCFIGAIWRRGFFQTHIQGEGIAILYSPVPSSEVIKYEMKGDKLSVDGNFVLMRSEKINFRAEKSSKSWIATSVSGEGLLQTFEGNGFVWVAPTQGVYEKLKRMGGIHDLYGPSGNMSTKTKSG